jgi:hypothetical protein
MRLEVTKRRIKFATVKILMVNSGLVETIADAGGYNIDKAATVLRIAVFEVKILLVFIMI